MPIFTPKTLIISFMDDDIRRAGYSIFGGGSKPYFTIENGALVLQNVPVPEKLTVDRRQLSVLDNIIGGSYLLEWLTLRIGLSQWYEVSVHQPVQNDPVEIACLLLERIKRETDRRGIASLFVMQWGSWLALMRKRPPAAAEVLDCARQHGLPVLDTWDALAAVHASEPERFKSLFLARGGHMSAAGNEFIAKLVAAALREQAANDKRAAR
jgi:hypothetical protein